ncbi:MAG: U32 family peptidase [Actinobacteria bacterium]|nr:U32 family peptidase [Actinomycetota bacterium]
MSKNKITSGTKIELVSPAGGWDSLKAAVNAGADAVYLGYKKFGARAYAENFELSPLKKAIKFAHSNHVKVYLTLNTLLKNGELGEVINFMNEYAQFCRDGVIIQDFGLYKILNDLFPSMRIHASTQLNTHNLYSVELLKELKFARVILAREMTFQEIKNLTDKKIIETEIFAHGSQCYSYSGSCYFSSFTGERSGNRGRCPQPCRMKYSLISSQSNGSDLLCISREAYLLSKSDLCTLEILPQIAALGVDALKIEGRMKSSNYVGIVTKIYRKYIDLYYKNPEDYEVDALDKYKVTQIFSRETGTGYFKEEYPEEIISQKKSGSVGNFLGRIFKLDFEKNKIKYISFKSNWPVNRGDIIEIWTKKGNEQININDIELVKEEAGKKLYKIPLKHNVILSRDDRIFKFYDKVLDLEAKKLLEIDVGNLKFEPESLPETGPEGGGVMFKKLEKIDIQNYLEKYDLVLKDRKKFEKLSFKKSSNERLELMIVADKEDIAAEALNAGADKIIYDNFREAIDDKSTLTFDNLIRLKDLSASNNIEFILNTPSIFYDTKTYDIEKIVTRLITDGIKNFAISNSGIIKLIAKATGAINLYLNPGLNIFNNLAVLFYYELMDKINAAGDNLKISIKGINLSSELNIEEMSEIIDIIRENSPKDINFSIFSYGYYPIMTTRYKLEFLDTKYKQGKSYHIKDSKGYRFNVSKDYNENMVIYNSRKICTIFDLDKIFEAGLNSIIIDTKFMKDSETAKVIKTYKKAINLLNKNDISGYKDYMQNIAHDKSFTDYTRGHLARGVL